MQSTLKNLEAIGRRRKRRKKLAGSLQFLSKRLLYILAFCFVLLAFLYGLFVSQILQITNITVIGIYKNDQFTKEVNALKGKNILFFRPTKKEQLVAKKFPELTGISIKKQLPHTIIIIIEQREPVALLTVRQPITVASSQSATIAAVSSTKTIGKYHLDAFGVPFAKIDDVIVIVESTSSATRDGTTSLPALIYTTTDAITLGQKIADPFIVQALALLQHSKGTQFRVIQATKLSEMSFEVVLADGMRVLFSTEREMKSQLAALQIIYEGSTIDKKKAKSIDVRFNKPVIKF